jgi:hypothetical protein
MLLGDINIPEPLLTAYEEGRLVIFTGAGISVDPPSNLPLFFGLAKQVAERVQSTEYPEAPEWKDHPDAFLGFLDDDEKLDIHRLVARIVTAPNSKPNPNHDALARIAAQSTARVVTTNYDPHLEARLRERLDDTSFEIYQAPAMPLGDDFKGLVYLHGSGAGDPERLVVTDRDFSKAYFHAAWAARFVERMFNHYVILFIGYSHSDVVMKYLGLGVGHKAERYVITDDRDNLMWKRLRVKVLDYPKDQHAVLTQCLAEWADLAEMGLLEHRQRIRSIVAGQAPSPEQSIAKTTPPAELSYIQDCIRRADRVGFFCVYATDPGWLYWIADEPPFAAIFDRSHPPNEVTARLAGWFVETFAFADEDTAKVAWSVFAAAGGTLSTVLWNALAGELHRYPNDRPDHVRRWLWLLLEQEHTGCFSDLLEYALQWEGVWEDRELTLAVFAHLLKPQLTGERHWGTRGLGVTTRGERYWLEHAWTNKFKPNLEAMVLEVFPVIDHALTQHLVLEERVADKGLGFSWRRPAIQPHPGDKEHHRQAIDILIDAARDCIETLWKVDSKLAAQTIVRWAASGYTLQERLALHGAGTSTVLDADAKVRFVLDTDLATKRRSLQETCHLLANAAADLSPAMLDELITTYAPASEDLPQQFSAFTVYELLLRNGAQHEPLQTAFNAIQTLHNFTPDENPGLNGGFVVTWVGEHPPLTTEEFEQKVLGDPTDAIAYINSFEDRLPPTGGKPTREDALGMLRNTVRERPRVGLDLWPHLTGESDIQGVIISAWGHVTDPDQAAAILTAITNADLNTYEHQVGQFLLHAAQNKDIQWTSVPGVDELIEVVWHACHTDEMFVSGEVDDWLSMTINVTVGHLMDFWFAVFHQRWTDAEADGVWTGLMERDRDFLNRALADHSTRGAHALTQISGRIAYLDRADPAWTRANLLPLRDWSQPSIAEPFWWGVLSFGRWNSGLVTCGLLQGLMETTTQLHVFTGDQRRRWAGFLASIAIRCETPPAGTWVAQFAALAAAADRELWLDDLADELEALDDHGRQTTWTSWLETFWRNRTQDDPVICERSEMNALAAIAPLVPADQFPVAVDLVEATPSAFHNHADASRRVTDDLIDTQPQTAARFYTHLMTNTSRAGFHGAFEVRPKLMRIVSKEGDWTRLIAAALALGIDLTPPA